MKKNTDDNENLYWSTFDLSVASTAKCFDYELLQINRDAHPNKALFIFRKNDELLKLVDDFYADRLQVNPRLFCDSQKLLKNRIHSSA